MLAESKGMHVLATAVDTMKEWTFSGIAVNPEWAATHRTIVVKYLRALRRAMQYGYTHKAELVADLMAEVKVDPAIANRAYDENWTHYHVYDPSEKFTAASLAYMTRVQIAMGIMTTAPPYADVYDGSFAAQIQR
jgi:ABC-type nitrate/sulfonate/bicarbonate transport system substrate-binding protein